ncbi:conserved hypothetical protein [Ricinus communis]|uniref:Uncharacterized protein n=1 Tax=Ricinus communis TaxID=3988 RepID=B9TFU3_RICCO|nr:conserved hypothetical protein [Ricinus communis]
MRHRSTAPETCSSTPDRTPQSARSHSRWACARNTRPPVRAGPPAPAPVRACARSGGRWAG